MNRLFWCPSLFFLLFIATVIGGCGEDKTSNPMASSQQISKSPGPPAYAGSEACADCHRPHHEAWQTSHHAYSMQQADTHTVLGDFQDSVFPKGDQTTRFFQAKKKFMVQTDGPDGQQHDYEVAYTFGLEPLQQYLVPFPKGRFQALTIAWDTRPKETGGQRWFHLYPDANIDYTDALHWTGPNQNWNYMCADCHSTNLQKHYDVSQDTYTTTWSDLNVGCEACHGPGSHHIDWAKSPESERTPESFPGKGLTAQFPAFEVETWQFAPSAPTATRQKGTPLSSEIDMCARCHSRRTTISERFQPGQPFLDSYLPALLEERLYHSDGQIDDEVYVYGSFLQSKMFQKGVTCHDCHEPHGGQLRATGNALCTRCHQSETFDSPEHHFHSSGSAGTQCVECHMPTKTYMGVDPRRDHSIRIPRPDLSLTLGTPNACTQCHKKQTDQWAAKEVKTRYGDPRKNGVHYGEVLDAGRKSAPGADVLLANLAAETTNPGIIRASALSLLESYPGRTALEGITLGLHDEDPLVRIGGLRALEIIAPKNRYALAQHLLSDTILAVRVEAGRRLASVPLDALSPTERTTLNQAVEDYLQAQWAIAERPEAHLNRGLVFLGRGQLTKAEEAYHLALQQDETFFPALVNLADLFRLQKRDQEGEATLRQALTLAPKDANVHHSLGLLLVRVGKNDEALVMFEQAEKFGQENPRHGYVYAVALSSAGKNKQALRVLDKTHQRHPNDPQLVFMLATLHRDQGNRRAAVQFAEKLLTLAPQDPRARQLLESLQAKK
jgi:predicted CXXCH cytochrome family protein